MPVSFYEVVWIFIVYAFIGWCSEVAYAAMDRGIFVNRGFLNGPYCPIYGCGVLTVVVILTPLKHNLILLYIGSFLLTSVIEFITGFVMERAFHNKWWDYSDKPFNIMGYVCLKFSIFWGFACSFIMLIIHPIVYGVIHHMPHIVGYILLSIIMICFFVDLFVTVSTIIKFNKQMKIMDEIAGKLKIVSNQIGENVYENVMEALEKTEDFKETYADQIEELQEKKENIADSVDNLKTSMEYQTEIITDSVKDSLSGAKNKLTAGALEAKEKLTTTASEAKERLTESAEKLRLKREQEELLKKYSELYNHRNGITSRLMKAFPDMKSRENNEILQKLKKHNLEKRKK